ncbi:hypothetical protein [Brevibacillus sp. NRS-1366]|uniref:hypothetical protein n=1 Tax=Brevibacillus sp. NRS-1366 TaxID=3233899 RepID=UPI003D1CC05E
MKSHGKWIYEKCDEENWDLCEDEYDTKEEAIEAARAFFKQWKEEDPEEFEDETGGTHFQVGQIQKYAPHINVESVIDDIGERAYDECGEWAGEYLYDVKSEHQNELEEKLNEALGAWIEKYGYQPRWFNVCNTEDVSIDGGISDGTNQNR